MVFQWVHIYSFKNININIRVKNYHCKDVNYPILQNLSIYKYKFMTRFIEFCFVKYRNTNVNKIKPKAIFFEKGIFSSYF